MGQRIADNETKENRKERSIVMYREKEGHGDEKVCQTFREVTDSIIISGVNKVV